MFFQIQDLFVNRLKIESYTNHNWIDNSDINDGLFPFIAFSLL